MKVHPDLQKTWLENYSHGDFAAIHRETGISVVTIRRSIEEGVCSQKTMEKINEYYIRKNERPSQIINKINKIENE